MGRGGDGDRVHRRRRRAVGEGGGTGKEGEGGNGCFFLLSRAFPGALHALKRFPARQTVAGNRSDDERPLLTDET